MYRPTTIVFILLGTLCAVVAIAGEQTGMQERDLTVGDVKRTYRVHVPSKYDGKRPVPVVIMLHGGGGTAKGAMDETGWDKKAEKEGFLSVFPDATRPDPAKPARFAGNPQIWNDGSGRFHAGEKNAPDIAFLSAVIDDLVKTYAVDARRIYITGFSNGASMSFRAGAELSKRIAAIAPVAGTLWLEKPALERPVPMLYITGAADPLNPLEGGEPKLAGGKAIGGREKPPLRDSIIRWAKLIGVPEKHREETEKDGVKRIVYGPGKGDAEVVFITVEGMGHTWAGGKSHLPESMVGKMSDKIDATNVIWEFFLRHPLPEGGK